MTEEWKTMRPEKLFVVFGFVLMAVSSFLPWLTASAPILFGLTLSRTGLELAPETGFFSILFLIVGSLVAWFYSNFKRAGTACLVMSVWMLIEAVIDYQQLEDRVRSLSTSNVFIWIGPGFYLLAVGVLISIIGSILLLRLHMKVKPKEATPSTLPQQAN